MTIQPKVCFNLFYYQLNVNWSILRQVVSIQKKWDYLIGMSLSLHIVLYGQRRRIEQYFWKSYILRYESLQRTSEAEGWNQKSSNSNSDKWCHITPPLDSAKTVFIDNADNPVQFFFVLHVAKLRQSHLVTQEWYEISWIEFPFYFILQAC